MNKIVVIALATLVGVYARAASSLDTSFNIGTGANGIVEQVLPMQNGKILICGNFTSFNGRARAYIARLNSDGSVDESFLAQPSYWVRNMSLQADGKIIIGGYFKSVGGQPRHLVARLHPDGALDTSFNPGSGATDIIAGGIDGNVDPFVFWTAVQPDGKILITGNFRNYNGASSTGLARINPDGSRDTTFNVGSGLNSWGRHILVLSNNQILVSGWFTSYNGGSNNRMARINPDGSGDSSFRPFIGDKTAIYSTVEVGGGKIIGAGHSLNEEGLFKREIARFNPDGSFDTSFVGTTNDKTESVLKQPDGKVIAVGSFSYVNGAPQKCLVRYFPDGSVDSSLKADIDNFVWGAALQADGKLLISGGFWTVDGQSRNGVARFHTGVTPGPQPEPVPALSATAVSSSQINLSWTDAVARGNYIVQQKVAGGTYASVATLGTSIRSYTASGLNPSTQYVFRLKTTTSSGTIVYSNESSATTLAASGGGGGGTASATFGGVDTTTRGSWKGVYGADGYIVIGEATRNPAYATVTATGKSDWTWQYSTANEAAVQKANSTDRIAACWYSSAQFSVEVRISDGQKHRVSFYLLDWDLGGRSQTIQVWDGGTGALLDTQTVSSFGSGKWYSWDVTGNVRFTIKHTAGSNAVVSGLFFGPGGTTTQQPVATPVISPNGGTFTSTQSVTLSTATTGAEIRYTTNGSEPTTSSTLYTGAFSVSATTTVKAKAFKSGMLPSGTASATFTLSSGGGGTTGGTGANQVRFLGTDTTTKGNWRGVYGADGYNVIAKSVKNPAYAQITPSGKSDWVWNDTTADTRALSNAEGTSRIASCWYAAGSFDINLNVTDGGTHKFSLYCLDWDNLGRSQKVELLDGATGSVLHSITVSGFSGGQYLNWDIKGNIKVRVTKLLGPNGVISGFFFGPASAPL